MAKITAQESETWPDRKRKGIGLVIYRLICLDAWCSTARASKMPLS